MEGRKSKKRQMNGAIGKAQLLRRKKDKNIFFSFKLIFKHSVSRNKPLLTLLKLRWLKEGKKACNNQNNLKISPGKKVLEFRKKNISLAIKIFLLKDLLNAPSDFVPSFICEKHIFSHHTLVKYNLCSKLCTINFMCLSTFLSYFYLLQLFFSLAIISMLFSVDNLYMFVELIHLTTI